MRELYQEMILEHYKTPRNYGKLENPDFKAEGYNPLCGDHIWIFLKVQDGKVTDVTFEGDGCAICTASASLMTGLIKGKTEEEADALFDQFRRLVTVEEEHPPSAEELGKLAVFSTVREYPTRIKCAILPWHTFRAALHNEGESISTE